VVAKPSDLDLNDGPARASRLFLIDGNSLAYRAFFALPTDMATASGQVTNAVFGFTSMLVNLLKDHKPDGIAVQGTLTVAVTWSGNDCYASGSLLG